jgi:hypothetical protein
MKISKEKIPVTIESPGAIMRAVPGCGGMTIAIAKRMEQLSQ